MKTILAISSLLSCCGIANAYSEFPQDLWKHKYGHIVAGIYGGQAVREEELNLNIQFGGFPSRIPAAYVNELSDNGLEWGLLIGYQEVYHHRLITGIEFNVGQLDLDHTHQVAFSDPAATYGTNAEINYVQDWVVNLTGRLGYALTPVFIPFLRGGVEVSRDDSKILFTANSWNFPQVVLDDERWVYRFLIGIGLEVPVPCRNISIRAEYLFHSKGKTIETDGRLSDGVVNPLFYAEQQPYTKSGRLSLIWNFTRNRIGGWQ